jgi:hypothetical protein
LGAGQTLTNRLSQQRNAISDDSDLGWFGRYLRYVRQSAINITKSDPVNPALAAGRKRAEAFNESLRKSGTAILQYRDDLATTFSTFEQFAKSDQGKAILSLLQQYDQAIGAAYGTSLEETKRLFQVTGGLKTVVQEQVDIFKGMNRNLVKLSRSYGDMTPEALRSTSMGSATLRQNLDFSQFGSTFQRSVGRLPNEFNRNDRQYLSEINRLSKELPDILSQQLEPETFRDSIKDSLQRAGFGEQLIKTIDAQLLGQSPEEFLNSLQQVGKVSAELIDKGFGPMLQNLQLSADSINQFRKAVEDNYDTLLDQSRTLADNVGSLQKLQADFYKTQQGFTGNQGYFNFGDFQARSEARQLGGTDNVSALGKQLKTLEEQFRETNDVRFASAAKITRDALKKLADSGLRTSDALNKLQTIESQQESIRGIGKKFFGGGIEERINLVRGFRETAALLQSGGTLGQVSPDVAARIIDTLESLGKSETNVTGGLPADQVLKELLDKSLGFTYKGNEQEALQREILTTQQDAIKAQMILADYERDTFNRFIMGLSQANQQFLNQLSTVLSGRAVRPETTGTPQAPVASNMPQPNITDGLNQVVQGFSNVGSNLSMVADKLQGLTVEHKMAPMQLEVVINGASVLQQMSGGLRDLVIGEVNRALTNYIATNLPDLKRPEPTSKQQVDNAMKWVGQWNK